MVDVRFPRLKSRTAADVQLVGQVRGRKRSINGTESTPDSLASYWMGTVEAVVIGEDETLEWRAFADQMRGGIGTCLFPVFCQYRPKSAVGRDVPVCDPQGLHGFEHWSFDPEPATRVALAEDAPSLSTVLKCEMIDCTGFRPSHKFSIGDRLHTVLSSWDNGSTIQINPPLRASHLADDHIEVDRPVCKMRLTPDARGDFPESAIRVYRPKLSLTEAL